MGLEAMLNQFVFSKLQATGVAIVVRYLVETLV